MNESLQVTAAGGMYRLCWCAGSALDDGDVAQTASFWGCTVGENFRVDVGTFTIVGASPLQQDRTCVSGQTCKVTGILGQDLDAGDLFLVLDTCGESEPLPRFSGTGLVDAVAASGASVSWGAAAVSAQGGQYRLCWCAGSVEPCDDAGEFRQDVGMLMVVGMAPLGQHRTCVSGQTCALDGLRGEHLSSSDRLLVLDTCGVVSQPPRFASKGLSDAATGSGALVSWGGEQPSSAGGQYRLCWCAAGVFDCSTAQAFRQDGGGLILVGPSPLTQARTCVAGQTCALTAILGQDLGDYDSFLVLQTCGTDSTLPRFGTDGLHALAATASGGAVSWGAVPLSTPGGQYRLCWCSGALGAADSAAACDTAEAFRVDVGAFSVIGPYLRQDRTCVSGQTCRVGSIQGLGVDEANRVLILDTCGTHSRTPRQRNIGFPEAHIGDGVKGLSFDAVTAAGGTYRLCWAAGEPFDMGTSELFRVDMGTLELVGPTPLTQDRTCVAGQTCALSNLQGHHLADTDRLLVLDTCAAGQLLPRFPSSGFATSATASGRLVSWGTDVVTSAGGEYRMCWCGGGAAVCSQTEHFKTDMGSLTIIGAHPVRQDRTCVSGLTCSLDGIIGQNLASSDKVAVLDTCGVSSTIDSFTSYGSSVTVGADGAIVSWGGAPLSAAGGRYRLCWCATANHECDVPDDFIVDIGRMTVIGPSPQSQDRTCVSGQTCLLTAIRGTDLHSTNRLLIMDTCGVGARPARLPLSGLSPTATSGATAAFGGVQLSAAGGSYRLCWCPGDHAALLAAGGGPVMASWQTYTLAELLELPAAASQRCGTGTVSASGGKLTFDLDNTRDLYWFTITLPFTFDAVEGSFRYVDVNGAEDDFSGVATDWDAACSDSSGAGYVLFGTPGTIMKDEAGVGLGSLSPGFDATYAFSRTPVEAGETIRFAVSQKGDLGLEDVRFESADITFYFQTTTTTSTTILDLEAQTRRCDTDESFRTDFGEFTLIGVSPLAQARTCVAGQTCVVDGLTGDIYIYIYI